MKDSYLGQVLQTYFKPRWSSFFLAFYFFLFSYFIIYHWNNLLIAARFIRYTLSTATSLLELPFLFWGAFFLIALLFPFVLSLGAICFPYEIERRQMKTQDRKLAVILFMLVALVAISFASEGIKLVAAQDRILPFILKQDLQVGAPSFLSIHNY